jgi:hypothetical protein
VTLLTDAEYVIAQERACTVVLFVVYFKIGVVVEGACRVSETVLLTQPYAGYLSVDTATWHCSNVTRYLGAVYRHV